MKTATLACAAAAVVSTVLLAPPDAHAKRGAVLLDVDYESGTENSGISDLTTTHASAEDASYIVEGGAHGSRYAIAHKVTLGEPGYFSDGAYRSESANNNHQPTRFVPGDHQRYEFSVRLPDGWADWSPGESANGEIIFQGKHAGGNPPSWMLMTKRNEIAFRSPGPNIQHPVIADYRPHVGQWLDFRVDVGWAADSTGYYRVWTRLPGQRSYRVVLDLTGLATWHPQNPADFGYLKWGMYRAATSLEAGDVPTRVIHHDEIRVMDLPGR